MPFGACTVITAAVITAISAAAANGVNRPRASSAPPANSAVAAARACSQPGRRPMLSNMLAVPSRPPPPKAPKSFWAPWPANSTPTTRRSTSNARSIWILLGRSLSNYLPAQVILKPPGRSARRAGVCRGADQRQHQGAGHGRRVLRVERVQDVLGDDGIGSHRGVLGLIERA